MVRANNHGEPAIVVVVPSNGMMMIGPIMLPEESSLISQADSENYAVAFMMRLHAFYCDVDFKIHGNNNRYGCTVL